jgi:hypothetical protein
MALWTPSNLGTSKCVAWFDASSISVADGAAVETWTSSEGNSVSATQTNSAKRPLYVATSTISGKPAVAFDGASSNFDHLFFSDSGLNVGTSGSLLCCFIGNANDGTSLSFGGITRGSSSGSSLSLLYQNNNTNLQLGFAGTSDIISSSNFPSGTTGTAYRSLVFGRHDGDLMLRYIGTEISDQSDASSGNATTTNYAIGSQYYSGGCEGEIAEIIYLSGLSLSEIQQVEGYAAHKYGLTAHLPSDHPYKNFPPTFTLPTVYWTGAGNLGDVSDASNWSDSAAPTASKKCVFNSTSSSITGGTLTAGEVRFTDGFSGNLGTSAAPIQITTDLLSIGADDASINVNSSSIADIYIAGNGRGVHIEGTATTITVESLDDITLNLTTITTLEVRHESGAGGMISTQAASNVNIGYGGNVIGQGNLGTVEIFQGGYLFQDVGSDINILSLYGGECLFHGAEIVRATSKIYSGLLTTRSNERNSVEMNSVAIYPNGTLDVSENPLTVFDGALTSYGGTVILGDGNTVAIS